MVAPPDRRVNMQVEIKMINNFHTDRPALVKSTTSRNLTTEEAEAVYSMLEGFLKNMPETKKEK